jgi:hypothetical protein
MAACEILSGSVAYRPAVGDTVFSGTHRSVFDLTEECDS